MSRIKEKMLQLEEEGIIKWCDELQVYIDVSKLPELVSYNFSKIKKTKRKSIMLMQEKLQEYVDTSAKLTIFCMDDIEVPGPILAFDSTCLIADNGILIPILSVVMISEE